MLVFRVILVVGFICSLIVFIIVMCNTSYEDEPIIYEHTDNDKIKELYITIDAKECHFVLKENEE